MRIILKLAILTGQRESEVAGALVVGTPAQHGQPQVAHPVRAYEA